MAAQPKKKISRVRGRTRRAHSARKLSKLPLCPQCHHPKPGHIVCPECGYYAGKKILHTKTDQRIAKQLSKTKKEQTTAKKPKPAPTKSPKDTVKVNPKKAKPGATDKNTRTTDEVKATKVKNK